MIKQFRIPTNPATYAAIALLAVSTSSFAIGYIEGKIDWKHRYDVLADSAGEAAIIEASIREQQR